MTLLDIYPTILDVLDLPHAQAYAGKSLFCKQRQTSLYASGRNTGVVYGKVSSDRIYSYQVNEKTLREQMHGRTRTVNNASIVSDVLAYSLYEAP